MDTSQEPGGTAVAPTPEALRAVAALRAFGTDFKRWVDSRLPADAGISYPRLRLIGLLSGQDAPTMTGLSRQLGTSAHNVTKLVDGLEDDGLVERTVAAADRRAVGVRLTPAGRSVETRLGQAHSQAVAEAFTVLSAAELTELTTLVERLQGEIRERLAAGDHAGTAT